MKRLLVTVPDDSREQAFLAAINDLGVHVEPDQATVEIVAALDVVLSLARSNTYQHPDKASSVDVVQRLRAKLREGLR